MADWKLDQPETDEVEVDEETLAAIDKGLKVAEEVALSLWVKCEGSSFVGFLSPNHETGVSGSRRDPEPFACRRSRELRSSGEERYPEIYIMDTDEIEDCLDLRDSKVKAQIRQANLDTRAGPVRFCNMRYSSTRASGMIVPPGWAGGNRAAS